jgi:rhomboid family GlyGly-CTERM serine protease
MLDAVFKRAPVTLAAVALCLLLACAREPLIGALAWERGAIPHGELWRLWTGHLVHYSASHALADALALGAAGLLAEPLAGSRRFALILPGGAGALSLGLLACAPQLQAYRGASGLAMLTAALAGVLLWRRHPAWRRHSKAPSRCACLLVAKTWAEAGGLAALADLPAGVTVAWQAHLLGALLGLAAGKGRVRNMIK